MEEKGKKKIGIFPIIVTVVAILAVAAVITFVATQSGVDLSNIIGSMKVEAAKEYLYENTSKISMRAVGKGFAVLTGTELRVMDEKGDETYLTFIAYSDPVMVASGGRAVAWDAGGKNIISFTERGEVFKTETENAITSVFVNSDGYVTAATEEPGYGGSVTIYNPNGRALYKWYSGVNYVVSGKIRDKTELLTLTIGKSGSALSLHRITDEAEQGSFSYDGVILDAEFNQVGVTAVTDTKLIFLNRNLSQRATYEFDGRHLDGYIIGDNFTLLVLSDYAVGGEREIVLVDTDGIQSSRLEVTELEGYALYDRTVAILSGGRVDFYNTRLERLTTVDNAGDADRIFLRDENTVILCGDYSAKVLTVG